MAESTLMMSKGKRSTRFRARSVLPEAVGPIKKTRGGNFRELTLPLPSPQKELIELMHAELHPCRPAMIALAAALRLLHFPQQGVHFLQGQLPAGAHRGVAGHGRQH